MQPDRIQSALWCTFVYHSYSHRMIEEEENGEAKAFQIKTHLSHPHSIWLWQNIGLLVLIIMC